MEKGKGFRDGMEEGALGKAMFFIVPQRDAENRPTRVWWWICVDGCFASSLARSFGGICTGANRAGGLAGRCGGR